MSTWFIAWIITTQCANFAFYLAITRVVHGWWRAVAAYVGGYLAPLGISLLWVNPQLHGGQQGTAGALALGFPLFFAVWSLVTMSMSRGTFGHRLFVVLVCGVHQIGAFVFCLLTLHRLSTVVGGALDVLIMAGMGALLLVNVIPHVMQMDEGADWCVLNLTAVMSLALLFVAGYYPTYMPTGSGGDITIFVAAYLFSIVCVPLIRFFAQKNRVERMLRVARENARVMLAEVKSTRLAEEGVRRVQHDMRHHVSAVREMLAAGRIQEAEEYLANMSRHELISSLGSTHWCANPLIDALFAVAERKAVTRGKKLVVTADVPAGMILSEPDVVALVGNLLDNAVLHGEPGEVRVTFTLDHGQIFRLAVENEVKSDFVLVAGLPAGNEGVGLMSVRRVVEKYHGLMGYEVLDNKLICKVVMGCV